MNFIKQGFENKRYFPDGEKQSNRNPLCDLKVWKYTAIIGFNQEHCIYFMERCVKVNMVL